MSTTELARELEIMHDTYFRQFVELSGMINRQGEEAVLLEIRQWNELEEEPLTPMILVEEMGLTSGRVANILRGLEQKQLIRRTRDGADGRKVHISLTDTGMAQARQLLDGIHSRNVALLDALGESDSQELMRLLRRLVYVLVTRNTEE